VERFLSRRSVLGVLTAAVLGGAAKSLGASRPGRPSLLPTVVAPAPTPPPTLTEPVKTASTDRKPPQYVLVSFDGAADNDLLAHWRDLGRRTGARFTFFLSGAYLLLRAHAAIYRPPRHGVGASDIGFFPVPAGRDPLQELAAFVGQLGTAFIEGHEIGTHYNGHFCGPSGRAVGAWSAEDWRSEVEQFRQLVADVAANNGLGNVDFPFGPDDIVGGRTPCLEGDFDVLYPVLAAAGFRYDASGNGPLGAWPVPRHGLWAVPLHAIPLAGTHRRVLAMDYNLYFNQTGARPARPEQVPAIRAQALQTYRDYFALSYNGARAPMSLGHHFTRWNGSAYVDALTTFIEEIASVPDVRFVTYSTLCDRLDNPAPSRVQSSR
jgi:hypothetical protein